jgi:protein TonB
MPNLASAISGVDFNIPGFGTDDGLAKGSDRILGDTNKKLVMTEDAVDNPPRPRSRVQPEYPEKARQRGITGYVTLSLLINDLGEVERVKVLDASPPGMFEQNAIASIRQWQFEPASYQGEPVKAWAKQTLRYELN